MKDFQDKIKQLVAPAVAEELTRRGLKAEDAVAALSREDGEAAKKRMVRAIFDNNGFVTCEDAHRFDSAAESWNARMTYSGMVDTLMTTNFSHLIPRVITDIVRDSVEPELVISQLFRTIRAPDGPAVVFPAWSAMSGVKDMDESDEYPELQGPRVAGSMTINIGKVGGAFRISEDVINKSQWDIMGIILRKAGQAMARHKEVKSFTHIDDNAVVSFDNSGGTSTHGDTTGRNRAMALNDTMILPDLFLMYADLLNDGFIPNTILVNPMTWVSFARDPSLRMLAYQYGGPLYRIPPKGRPGVINSWDPNFGLHPGASDLNYSSTLNQSVPSGPFPAPLTMVISPFVSYTSGTNKTNIYLIDREEMGVRIETEAISVRDWDEPSRDIKMVRLRERYGFGVLHEGRAIRVAKDVSLALGYDIDALLRWDLASASPPS